MKREISIGAKKIGNDYPVYVIAEAGVNHNGDIELAKKLIYEAKKAGADCVKFQTFKAESVVTSYAPKAKYQLEATGKAESQLEMLKKLELSADAYPELMSHAADIKIDILSTPYSFHDAKFLDELGFSAFKIASGQLVELTFLEKVAKLNKPVILSTGMGTMEEVIRAVETIQNSGNKDLIVLQCTTNYPSAIEDANILAMNSIASQCDVMVGYSDHVESNYACYAAVARGGRVIEKHFTLDKKMPGPDHSCSLDPGGFSELVEGIRKIESSLGNADKNPSQVELKNMVGMRRSIVATCDLSAGTVIKPEDITCKRPATGISPEMEKDVIGKRLKTAIKADQQIEFDLLE